MHSLEESLAAWSTIIAAAISVFGLVQSRAWLAGFGVLFAACSLMAGLYARNQRRIVRSAAVRIEGRSIDSLNVANLARRTNRSLVVQEAHHVATIEGERLWVSWTYSGYCLAEQETTIQFSIDSDSNVPFVALECFAYDLQGDPNRTHKIRPLLIGPDGISKKIAVPFLQPLSANKPFSVLLECALPGCMKAGVDYYTSTLSFAQNQVRRCSARLEFIGVPPQWVRVYQCDALGQTTLLKDLQPCERGQNRTDYLDLAENVPAQSARIYMFYRPPVAMEAAF